VLEFPLNSDYSLPVRGILSILLAGIIFLAFGGVAFFFINISGEAKFERKDKQVEKPAPE
jgi:hypothetical protein